jgi:hypothetical protein
MNNTDQENDFIHKLWLIYSQLKDVENDPVRHIELLERSREELGAVLNDMYKCNLTEKLAKNK